jgi:hypothetical protein
MGKFLNESVQTQIEQKVTKVFNNENDLKGGSVGDLIQKIENIFLQIDDHIKNILDIDQMELNISDDEISNREVYLKEFYDINDEKERISTLNFLESELNHLYQKLNMFQKLIEPYFPERFSWEEEEDDNGIVRGEEEVIYYNFISDTDLDSLNYSISSDNEYIIYNYYKVNQRIPTEIRISYTELLENLDSTIYLEHFHISIEEIIKSKI